MKLLTWVCMPLAVLLVVCNLVWYPSLVQSPRFVTSGAAIRSRLLHSTPKAAAHHEGIAIPQQKPARAFGGDSSISFGGAKEILDDGSEYELRAPEGTPARKEEPSLAESVAREVKWREPLRSRVTRAVVDGANAAASAVGRVASMLQEAAGNTGCKPQRPDWKQRPLNWIVPLESAAWPAACDGETASVGLPSGWGELCSELPKVAKHREVLLVLVDEHEIDALRAFGTSLTEGARAQLLVAALDEAAAEAARSQSFSTFLVPKVVRAMPRKQAKYAAIAAVLRAGCSLVSADLRVSWSDSPFPYLHRNTDVEAVGIGGYHKHGAVMSVDDAAMGWSRYAQSLVISP